MYKHECVKCLEKHSLKCIWHIGFWDRFLGTEKVKYCPEFYNDDLDKKRGKKQK